MTFLLDTNIAIALRDRDLDIIDRVEALGGSLIMSIVTRIELEGGVYSQPRWTAQRRERVNALVRSLSILTFDDVCADAYGQILRATGFSRRRILDRMIAAQAIVHRATLVTRNGTDFRDIPGLTLLEW